MNSIQGLAGRWYHAATNSTDTDAKNKLYADTNKVQEKATQLYRNNYKNTKSVSYAGLTFYNYILKPLYSDPSYIHITDRIKLQEELYAELTEGFDTLSAPELDTIAKWIYENTLFTGGNQCSGALAPLSKLMKSATDLKNSFTKIAASENQKIDEKCFKKLENLQYIFTLALHFRKTADEPDISELEPAMFTLSDKDKLAIRATSLNNRAFVDKSGFEISIRRKEALDSPLPITAIDFRGFSVDDEIIKKIAERCAKLESLKIYASYITDQSASLFATMTKLEVLSLENCKKLTDFSFLNELKHLIVLEISFSNITDLSFLTECPSIGVLDLKGCPNIQDYSPLLKLEELKTIVLSKDSIDAPLEEALRKKNIEILFYDAEMEEKLEKMRDLFENSFPSPF